MAIQTSGIYRVGTEVTTNDAETVASFRAVTNRRVRNEDGEYEEHGDWLTIRCFERNIGITRSLKKGSLVEVTGELQVNIRERDGVERTFLDVIASTINFVPGGTRANSDNDDDEEEDDEPAPRRASKPAPRAAAKKPAPKGKTAARRATDDEEASW